MKIYTRAGDHGTTALFGGGKVSKSEFRICAYGTLDELNALLGLVRSGEVPQAIDEVLSLLQNQLFDLGAELANPNSAGQADDLLQENDVVALEHVIDRFEADLPELRTFILPGGSPAAAALHLARCVCRRAEREIVALGEEATVRETVLKYVNRVSDLLFVLARSANAAAGVKDVSWSKSS